MAEPEPTDTDSPLRDTDPLRWSALRACEFSEAVPYCTFDGDPPDGATCAEAFLHLSNLTRYVRAMCWDFDLDGSDLPNIGLKLLFLWNNYAVEKDENMTEDGRRLAKSVRDLFTKLREVSQ